MNFLTNCCIGLWLNNKEPVLFRLPSGWYSYCDSSCGWELGGRHAGR